MSGFKQLSLFEFEGLRGTTIQKFKKYIGLEIELYDVLTNYWKENKKGIVSLIEKICIDGNAQYRIELDNGTGILTKNVVDIFEQNEIYDKRGIDRLFRDKDICFVSFNEIQTFKNRRFLKNITDASFVSVEPEAVYQYSDMELYSFDNIMVDGRRATKITIVEDDYYMQLKEKEKSEIFHINKNSELVTLCGKHLEFLIDMQDFSEMNTVCKRCKKLYEEQR